MVDTFLTFVPPGGGEADYEMAAELPGVPQPGDYVSIWVEGDSGTRDFIVRRTWWLLETGADATSPARVKKLFVECEFAVGQYSSESHKRSCGPGAKSFEASAY